MRQNVFLNKMKVRSTFTKLVLSYVLIAILIILILSVVLYELFLNNSLQVIEADSRGRLSQNINHLNLVETRVFSLGQMLIKDSDIIQAIYGDNVLEPTDQADLYRKLHNAIDSDTIIHSIFLYNANTKEINDTFGNESKESFTRRMLELLKGYNEVNKFQFSPNKIKYKKVNGDIKSENIISVTVSDSGYYSEKSSSTSTEFPSVGALIINLNADAIQGSIAPAPQDQKSETIIIDKKGNVIFDSIMKNFSGNMGKEEYIRKILVSNKKEDTLTKVIDGEKSLIVYRKTHGAREWTFINVYTYKNMFSSINRLGIVIIYICIGILIISLAFSVITAKTIYNPFNRLLNRVREGQPNSGNMEELLGDAQYLTQTFNSIIQKSLELESSVNSSIPMLKKALLKKVVQGKCDFEPVLVQRFHELFADLINNKDGDCFSIVVFTIDNYMGIQEKENKEGEDIVLSSMEILINKMLSEYFICESIDYEDNYIYLIIKLENNRFMSSKEKNILSRIHNELQVSLQREISCSIGMPVKCVEDIHLSYSDAFDLIKYRLVYGYGSFFCYDMEEMAARDTLISIDKEKEKLIQSIKICDLDGVRSEIDGIIHEISQCQYDYIMLTMNQLMLDIVKSVKAFYADNSNELDFNNIYSNINKIGTLEEMREFFILYCNAAIDKIEKKKLNRKSDMFLEVISYISEHYKEYDISTEFLANMVNLTPGYFGKLFTESFGKTVSEYIMELRLSKAQELLCSTSLTINEISLKIGFSNSTYFAKLFKKSLGITPNQYRIDNKVRV